MKTFLSVIAIIIFVLPSCQKDGCNNGVKAEFKDLTGLDGCGFVIDLNEGKRLEPTNLSEFNITPENGKKIWVKYHETEGGSICMSGEIVEIDCISIRK